MIDLLFHRYVSQSEKTIWFSRETLGGYSETVYRYMEGAGEFYGG